MIVDLLGVRQFHDVSQIHDGDAVGNVPYHQKVVGDEEIGQSQLILQFIEHVDDLCLDGDVQSRDRFVTDNEFGVYRQSPGDADTLTLAAGELVGIPGGVLGVQSYIAHQFQDPVMPFRLGGVQLVHIQGFPDDVRDGHAGVQGRVGVLEDHGGLLAELVQVLFRDHLFPVIPDLAGSGFVQLQDSTAHGGLAAAGLSHETQGLALPDLEGDIIHCLQVTGLEGVDIDLEVFFQVTYVHQRSFRIRHRPRLLSVPCRWCRG